MNFPQYFNHLVKKSGIKKTDIAKKLGFKTSYISHLTNPEKNLQPSPELLEKLSVIFNVSYEELFFHTEWGQKLKQHSKKIATKSIPIVLYESDLERFCCENDYEELSREWLHCLQVDERLLPSAARSVWFQFKSNNSVGYGILPSDLLLIDLNDRSLKPYKDNVNLFLIYENGEIVCQCLPLGNGMVQINLFDDTENTAIKVFGRITKVYRLTVDQSTFSDSLLNNHDVFEHLFRKSHLAENDNNVS